MFGDRSHFVKVTDCTIFELFTGGRQEDGHSGSDDDGSMFNDNASMTSEVSSIAPEDDGVNNGIDESSKIEMFESKLKEALELATQKSAAGRVKAMEAICGAFLKRYCPDFVENQQVVLLNCSIIFTFFFKDDNL